MDRPYIWSSHQTLYIDSFLAGRSLWVPTIPTMIQPCGIQSLFLVCGDNLTGVVIANQSLLSQPLKSPEDNATSCLTSALFFSTLPPDLSEVDLSLLMYVGVPKLEARKSYLLISNPARPGKVTMQVGDLQRQTRFITMPRADN